MLCPTNGFRVLFPTLPYTPGDRYGTRATPVMWTAAGIFRRLRAHGFADLLLGEKAASAFRSVLDKQKNPAAP